MEEWHPDEYVVEIPDANIYLDTVNENTVIEENSFLDIKQVEFSSKPSRPSLSLIDRELYAELNESKNGIANVKNWDKWSRLVNLYEKIKNINKTGKDIYNKIDSRAFYKLYEIIKYFNLINKFDIKTSFHFCEAPGGFVQCMLDLYPNVEWYAQSLYVDGLEVYKNLDGPKWIRDGDGTGSLYNIENINALEKRFCKNSAESAESAESLNHQNKKIDGYFDFITADGGFDISVDPNNKEQYHLRLITCEIIGAIKLQKKGGSFVCKIFDSVTKPTCQLIVLLKMFYKKVFIYKPRTSRFQNSEKYIVCLDFNGIDKDISEKLNNIVSNWNNEMFCKDFSITIPNKITKCIYAHNEFIVNNQIKYIEESKLAQKYTFDQISTLEATQNKRAIEFCIGFGIISNDTSSININNNIKCSHYTSKDDIKTIKKCILCDKLYVV